jgi:demethylmenaquinone methyltransferase/2-methoxy-6-polyprenyl-1,4-benzoquinol methylase
MMNDLLQTQILYYRARSAEYDEWFYRKGRYDHGEELNAQWFREADLVRQALLNRPKVSNALELACGTGIWTQELIQVADRVVAFDASPEMIAINRAKLQSDRVTYREMNLFEWQPDEKYDLIFFGFWLSHVPPDKLHTFLSKVAQSLAEQGSVFMIDSRKVQSSTAHDLVLPKDEDILMERTLNDGRTFKIVKIYYQAEHLAQHFVNAGLQPTVHLTDRYFIWATAETGLREQSAP